MAKGLTSLVLLACQSPRGQACHPHPGAYTWPLHGGAPRDQRPHWEILNIWALIVVVGVGSAYRKSGASRRLVSEQATRVQPSTSSRDSPSACECPKDPVLSIVWQAPYSFVEPASARPPIVRWTSTLSGRLSPRLPQGDGSSQSATCPPWPDRPSRQYQNPNLADQLGALV